jgi:predicted nucleic acid-binding protein
VTLFEAVSDLSLLGVDTAPFIYFVEQNAHYMSRVNALFQQVSSGQIQVFTSVISLAEVLTMPIRMGSVEIEKRYRSMLLNTRNIHTLPITSQAAYASAQLRVNYNLKLPDALQIAVCMEAECQAFLTNDFTLRRVQEISVLLLDELL